MDFFKPEDFGMQGYGDINKEMASRANAKLEREGLVVSGFNEGYPRFWSKFPGFGTHEALIINIQPRKKCGHPKEKISVTYVQSIDKDTNILSYRCTCGANVHPQGFEEVP